MKTKWIDAYMDVAERFSQLSSATILKVGSVVVKDHRIISIGYNGTPAGWDNDCEYWEGGIAPYLVTKPEVIHAEANAILKLAKSNDGGDGAVLFCTHAPCVGCAKMIYGAGIKTVYYARTYKNTDGVEFLKKAGVEVIHHEQTKSETDSRVHQEEG